MLTVTRDNPEREEYNIIYLFHYLFLVPYQYLYTYIILYVPIV